MRVVEEEELLAGEAQPLGIEQLEKRLRGLLAVQRKGMEVGEGLGSIGLLAAQRKGVGGGGQG